MAEIDYKQVGNTIIGTVVSSQLIGGKYLLPFLFNAESPSSRAAERNYKALWDFAWSS